MATPSSQPVVLALDDPEWHRFATETPECTPFHHPAWAQMLAATYHYPGFALGVRDGSGRLVAGAPFLEVRGVSRRRRWVSLPFTDECPPLATGPGGVDQLADALVELQGRRPGPAVELRGAVGGIGWRSGADAVIHELELSPDVNDVRGRFSKSQVVRNISRAQRAGVVVRRANAKRDLEAFYDLHARTRRRQGVPVQPRRFFELLWTRLIEPGLGYILLAYTGGDVASAGALFLQDRGTTIYKFGASEPGSWPSRPNHLIFWTAIQDACAHGDRRFDFGRTDLGNDGLRAFKRAWGGRERPLVYSTLAPRAAAGAEPALNRALSVTIRNSPPWVCRGVGAALYRFAGSR
jgi:CelD/BcsL family acetyltransferase involved in cellulose biosynthesis